MSDPRLEYLSQISLEKSFVLFNPPIVLLFGGGTLERNESFREKLNRHTVHKPWITIFPENFPDWLHDSAYPDLILFESDLGQLSTSIVIILECPGALSELGTFAVNSKIINKTHVVVEQKYYEGGSYIEYGPLRRFKEENLLYYPICFSDLTDSEDNTLALTDIIEKVSTRIETTDTREYFNSENDGHVAFLIKDLVSMFYALKQKEIRDYLDSLGLKVELPKIKRLLFLMTKLGLIEVQRFSSNLFYISLEDENRMNFRTKEEQHIFDRTKVELNVLEYYSSEIKEKIRSKVIKGSTL